MSSFRYSIEVAFIIFPFVAFLFTLPYMLGEYHKNGSISFFKTIVIYSFVLYLMNAYFLVILPLPSKDALVSLPSVSYNLHPVHFINEILNTTSFHVSDFPTYFPTMKNPVLYEAIFNIFLTLPFGVYLHYYFNKDLKRVVLYSFLFSLFFELTQLSGLYFIYPKPYRVFDVDDLLLNTFGGFIGYFGGSLLLKILPSKEVLNKRAKARGVRVTFVKRIFCFLLDIAFFSVIFITAFFFLRGYTHQKEYYLLLLIIVYLFYYPLMTMILHGKTIFMKFLNLEFVSEKKVGFFRILIYYLLNIFFYLLLPVILLLVFYLLERYKIVTNELQNYAFIVVGALTILLYNITFLSLIFGVKTLPEKITNIRMISTIKDE